MPEGPSAEGPTSALVILDRTQPVLDAAPLPPPPSPVLAPAARVEAVGSDPSATLSVHTATAYAWRGLNRYGRTPQEVAAVVAPALTLRRGAFVAGWATAAQVTGTGLSDAVGVGNSLEQDLHAGAEHSHRAAHLAVDVAATVFPFADAERTGTVFPAALQPGASVTVGDETEARFEVRGFQTLGATLWSPSHVWAGASVERHAPVGARTELVLGASAGAKAWAVPAPDRSNTYDAEVRWGLGQRLGAVTVAPAVHLSWSDRTDAALWDETFVWLSVDNSFAL